MPFQKHLMATACILLSITLIKACSPPPKSTLKSTPPPVPPEETWTRVELPEGADLESDYWKGVDLSPKPPVLPLPVDLQQEKFILPPGYKLDAVLTEPDIQQPGAITFDANGRMYVLELRSYMLTVDSEGTLEPVSGISRWEDKDNDGVYESGGMFVDKLVFPRFVLPLGPNSILTMESNADDVFMYTDTDGDGKADKKEFFTSNFGRAGNVEHQQAFLYWGMDNWLYSTVNPFRVRWTPNGVVREATASNHSQWGITHDDDGRLWFQGGASGLPGYFQFPVHYGDYVVKDSFAEGFEVPWGAPVLVADMQGGMRAVRMPEGTLNRVTGAAGNDVFRGHRLPEELIGQYFYGEPVARIVRQVNEVREEGLSVLHNVYQDQQAEFIRSTDPLFRPVDMATAPDGTMYIVDMYHGIIQEGQWTPVGSYIRAKIQQYQLDKVVSLGRIWRLTHDDFERDKTQPRMYDESSLEVLQHLKHKNGWWRDLAQQVLVQRRDTSITPELTKIIREGDNLLAKFHALWVLEGIGTLDAALVRELMADPNPRMRIQALWVSETLYKAGDKSFEKDYLKMMTDSDTDVMMRAMMTGRMLKIPGTLDAVKKAMAMNPAAGVQLVGNQIIEPPVVNAFFGRRNPNYSEEQQALLDKGQAIYNDFCSTCHGRLGGGTPAGDGLMAPSVIASERIQSHPDYIIKTLLHGLTGELDGEHYSGVMMAPMRANDDEWIAAISSFIRVNFENESSFVTPEEVARVRAATIDQTQPYTLERLRASIPKRLPLQENWKVSASHSADTRKGSTSSPLGAFNFEGWTSGGNQQAGMWFQIELPEAQRLAEIKFESPVVGRGWREGSPPPLQTSPKGYTLSVSNDGENWTTIIRDGASPDSPTRITFEPVEARFLRITLTQSEQSVPGTRRGKPHIYEVPWNMREFELYAL